MSALTLQLPPVLKLTDEQFEQLAAANQDLQLELTAKGELIIMPPTGGETGNRNLDIEGQLWLWNRQTKLGKAFNSSTGFKLPNGATRSPDASWVIQERWDVLTQQQRKKFLPLCPDFAIELVSETDDVEETRKKMQEYISNGLRLGWLINPKIRQVEIYRQNRDVEVLDSPATLSGEDILPAFILDLQAIFE
ncbi:Uma2 family endonuclease [Microcoleus sp. FACHB-672]|uniref:Uma2 family endonuclease n=1 Tax=Microcoleus sp. FACHB-672 TaxID=2692825 RepID=UPI001687DAC2|nr:Uma2 family endonuclease [Microcoleus sp. FACHB-672]MBD2042633.1 Uma2 family endonuclease [Microcoleus sp. FACHB-672]